MKLPSISDKRTKAGLLTAGVVVLLASIPIYPPLLILYITAGIIFGIYKLILDLID